MNKKCGVITVLGETNSGKSTLVNALVGQKVSIVSRKVQTTIFNISGIYTDESTQIILIDTPGFFKGKNAINYERRTWDAFRQTKTVLFVIDAHKKIQKNAKALIEKIDKEKDIILVINKIDLVKKTQLLSIIDEFSKIRDFSQVFMVSSMYNDGVEELREYLLKVAPDGDWLFPEDETTDQSIETYVSEITREHVYDLLHQELPYVVTVKTVSIEKRAPAGWIITQEIIVEKDSHKAMIIGKGGTKIKAIGSAARKELSDILECPIQLFLTVKVAKK